GLTSKLDALPGPAAQPGDTEDPDKAPSLDELEEIARRLSEAHDVLLAALESAEKG
ncbi:hypothetical protein O980_12905, partial [Mycobacterium avium subsp. paratuberculosis 08-8281]